MTPRDPIGHDAPPFKYSPEWYERQDERSALDHPLTPTVVIVLGMAVTFVVGLVIAGLLS